MAHHLACGMAIEALDVIVVDDARPMQTLLRSMLAAFHVARIRVFDGAEPAFQAMIAEPPHIVISDWRMKPTTGYQLLRAIRRPDLEPLCHVPFVMISAFATRSAVESALRAGAHAFVVKPIAPAVLLRNLRRVVNDRRPFRREGDYLVIDGAESRLAEIGESESTVRRLRAAHRRRVEADSRPSGEPAPAASRAPRRGYGAINDVG